ncbi:diguanylate cyclase [Neptuniibacter caesariensis]
MFNLLDQSALEDTDKLNTAKLAKLECLYLAGKFAEAENFLSEIKQQKFNEQQSLELNIVLITQYTRYGHLDLAIRQGLSGLAGLGYELPEAPDMEAVGEAIGMIQVELENCPFAELLDKPQLTDATISRVMEILIAMQPCCYNSGSLLFPLTILHLLKLTMQHGNTQHSSYVFMMYALMCTKVLKDYSTAFEADRCSRLVGERFPAPALVDGRLRMMRANFVQPWQQPLINSSSLRDDAYHACLEQGDYYWGVHAYLFGFYADLFASNSISPLLERTQQVISTCTKIKQPAQVFLSQLQSNLLSILSGKLDNLVNLDHEPGYEAKALQHYQDTGYMCGKYDRLLGRLLQGYLFGSYRTALEITLDESLTNADLDEGIFHEAAYVFLNMLCILAIQHESASDIPSRWLDWYAQAKERLLLWNSINPDTFSPMHYLVEAEEARLAAQRVEAMCSYEKAIHSAQGSSLLLEALANERMGCFRISLQQESLGRAYIEEAIRLYSDWGATAKAGELEQYLGNLQSPQSLPRGTEFDWHAVLAASQEISQEVNLDNLLRVALERVARVSGAEKVSYFSCSDGAWRLEGLLDKDHFSEPSEQPGLLPESVLNYCNNSKEILSLKDALFDGDFILDPYIQHFRIRSLLALPLIYRDQIVAVILCEHSETSNLFSANRQQILTVLASQLVISLSNAEMYQSLENQNQDLEQMVVQRTASLNKRTKHLEAILESLPIPYVVSSLKGRVISANKLWYQLFMLDGEAAKKVNTAEFYINPDDRDRMVLSLMHKGHVTDFDCELKNHHGEPFWALFSATLIEVQGEQAVFAAMSDISARKALEGMLHKQAHTDPLTGILNRRAVLDLSSQYKKAAEDESVFVAMLDLDYFKRLNDTYSHSAGDQVLKAFASEVSGLLRDGDVFARMGGEEFLVMLSVGSEEQAELILQRIREKIAMMTVPFDSVDLKVTVSIGFAAWSSDAEFKQVTHQADLALYEAKGRGRNMVVCLD